MRNSVLRSRAFRPLIASSVLAIAMAGMPASAPAQDDTSDLSGEIRFSWWGGQVRNDKTDQIIQMFEAEHPDVSVVRENADWEPYWQRLTIQSTGNNQPCAITMQTRWLATFARPDILMPLDELVENGTLDLSGIPQPVIDSGRGPDGNLYMVPHGVFYFALMYNEQMAENAAEAGVEMPEYPYNWDEFAQYLRDVLPTLEEGAVATHNMGIEADSFVTWVQSHGEDMFDGSQIAFSRESVIDWFNYWEALRQDGVTEPPEVMLEDNSALIEQSNLANARGFVTNRPPNQLGSVQTIVDTVSPGATIDIMPYPVGPEGTVGMDLGANGIAIGANCPEEKLPIVTEWINFFTQNAEAAEIYESDNGVVAVTELATAQAENPDTQPTQVRHIELYQQLSDTANPVFWPPNGYQALDDTLGRAYEAVAFGALSVEEGADQFLEEFQQQLDQAARETETAS